MEKRLEFTDYVLAKMKKGAADGTRNENGGKERASKFEKNRFSQFNRHNTQIQ